MDSASVSRTSATLLGRLRDPNDQAAWAVFVDRYGPNIYGWCRRWGLQEADAEDVTQNVLLTLARRMSAFVYDPARSFRAWLKTVAHNALNDYLARRERPGRGSGDSHVANLLDSVAARDDLLARLSNEFDHELLQEATVRVQLRVEVQTWEAFRLTAVEGLSGAVAAGRLGVPVATVFKYKSRVQQMLRDELRKLDDPVEEP